MGGEDIVGLTQISVASIINRNGDVVVPSAEALQRSQNPKLGVSTVDSPNAGAYPLNSWMFYRRHLIMTPSTSLKF
ncbi:hypothetical protein HDV00_012310 [Rhizophlyctis rosea]|nr:hypothetical protein HDV00_012310 [Rhizophlyctis rosea]